MYRIVRALHAAGKPPLAEDSPDCSFEPQRMRSSGAVPCWALAFVLFFQPTNRQTRLGRDNPVPICTEAAGREVLGRGPRVT